MTMAMIAKIERMLMDENRPPDERSVWGFIFFLVYTRFRAFDGARIPHEPKLEREDYNVHSILSTTTMSELTKNGHRASRRGTEMTIVAHAIGISGVQWGKTWLELRAAQGLHAERWGVLQPNVDKKYRPIPQTTMTAERVTWFVRHVAKMEMHMDDEAVSSMSSHTCKPSWLTVWQKKGRRGYPTYYGLPRVREGAVRGTML